MITFKIDGADIILNDLGDGKGKIIISDDNYGYNFSYFWGAMGCSLIDFLSKINTDYFINKLGPVEEGYINTRKTLRNIRKAIKEELLSQYPWYTQKEFYNGFNTDLKKLANSGASSYNDFSRDIDYFITGLNYYWVKGEYEKKIIEATVNNIFNESWNYIEYDENPKNVYLKKLHKKLVKHLKTNNFKTIQIV